MPPQPIPTSTYTDSAESSFDYSLCYFSGLEYRDKKTDEFQVSKPDNETIHMKCLAKKEKTFSMKVEDLIGCEASRNLLTLHWMPQEGGKPGKPGKRTLHSLVFTAKGTDNVEARIWHDCCLLMAMI